MVKNVDPGNIEAQIASHRTQALRTAKSILGGEDAEDAVQDAALRAWKYQHNWNPALGDFWRWYSRIVTHASFAILKSRQEDAQAISLEDPAWDGLQEQLASRDEPVGDSLLRDLAADYAQDAVAAALKRIDPDHRDLIKRVYLQGEDRIALAAQLRISPQALRMRISRAVQALRPELQRALTKCS